jgi:hypothetical protein
MRSPWALLSVCLCIPRNFLADFPHFEKIKYAYEITLLCGCVCVCLCIPPCLNKSL